MSCYRWACSLVAMVLLGWLPAAGASETTNTLNWKVGSERNVYGYLVYRAERANGPYRRIHFAPVGAPASSADAGRYRHVDRAVTLGTTYHYVIYSVGMNGVKQRLAPPRSKIAGENSTRLPNDETAPDP